MQTTANTNKVLILSSEKHEQLLRLQEQKVEHATSCINAEYENLALMWKNYVEKI